MPHSPPCPGPRPTVPPAGAGGGFNLLASRNFLRSNSCDSSKTGIWCGSRGKGCVWKYGCCNASIALMRFRQSSFSNSLSRDKARGLSCLKRLSSVDARGEKSLTPSQPGNCDQPGMFVSVGDPTRSKIICAWLRSLLPVRMGLPSNISPKTQPTPHMSMAVVYFRNCRSSSGGRYHRVTTSVVYSLVASPPPRPGFGTSSS